MKVISMNKYRERTNKLFLPPDREEGDLRTAITFLEAAQTLLDADEDERKAWLQDVELQGDLAEAELTLCERGPDGFHTALSVAAEEIERILAMLPPEAAVSGRRDRRGRR